MKTQKMYCPECDRETEQRIEPVNAGKPDEGGMYVCTGCNETTGMVEDEKVMMRLREICTAKPRIVP